MNHTNYKVTHPWKIIILVVTHPLQRTILDLSFFLLYCWRSTIIIVNMSRMQPSSSSSTAAGLVLESVWGLVKISSQYLFYLMPQRQKHVHSFNNNITVCAFIHQQQHIFETCLFLLPHVQYILLLCFVTSNRCF